MISVFFRLLEETVIVSALALHGLRSTTPATWELLNRILMRNHMQSQTPGKI